MMNIDGQAHKQRQGTGFATVINGDKLANTQMDIYDDQIKRYDADLAEKKKQKDAAVAKLAAISPDYFAPHQEEMRSKLNATLDIGTQAMLDGIGDPFIGSDEKSRAFRASLSELEAMSKASLRVKDYAKMVGSDMSGKDPETFDADSVLASKAYLDKPLSKHIEEGGSQPILALKTPILSTQEFWTKQLTPIMNERKDEPLSAEEISSVIDASFSDPNQSVTLTRAYGQRIKGLQPEEKARLQVEAMNNGKELWEQMATNDVAQWQSLRTSYDFNTDFMKFVEDMKVPTASSSTDKGSYSGPDSKEWKTTSEANMRLWLKNPQRLTNTQLDYPLKDGENEDQYISRIAPLLATKAREAKPTSTTFSKTSKAEDEQAAKVAQQDFLGDIYSNDLPRIKQAAQSLIGTKAMTNLGIVNVNVVNDYPTKDAKRLEFELETNTSAKAVLDKMKQMDGASDIFDETQVAGNGKLVISLRPDSAQQGQLLNLYNKMAKETNAPYMSHQKAIDATTPKAWGGTSTNDKFKF